MDNESKIKLTNWLNRKIAEAEYEASKYDPLNTSRTDEMDEALINGMKSAYEDVKRHINQGE